MSSVSSAQLTLRECFQDFSDPRREHGRLHSLWDLIGLTICAMICGSNDVVEIENYGLKKIDFLKSFLDLENGIPSHDTIGRVFSKLDPKAFRESFAVWVENLAQSVQGRVIAIDGKTLRRSHDKEEKPLHLVSAFAAENRLVLTQQAVDEKSNEITAIPELLKVLDVKKAIITIDAMGCQKEIAAQIERSRRRLCPVPERKSAKTSRGSASDLLGWPGNRIRGDEASGVCDARAEVSWANGKADLPHDSAE